MIGLLAPLGRLLVLGAVAAAAAGTLTGFAAGARRSDAARRWTWRLAYLFAGLMAAANLVMVVALLAPDFSVGYVAQVGSRSVPAWVAAVSLWSALEGSILFWGVVLGAFTAGLAWVHRRDPAEQLPWAIALMLAVGVFFGLLIAGPANPFLTVSPPPADGPGPNPLLQNHLLMVVHPPMLYLGYVGLTAPFALAAAALITGRAGREVLGPLRRWLLGAWTFLTAGIVLGGWWAYEVLGWGGYWAWDPVENASLLPWLTATAALHSLIVVERRGALKGWSLTLVLASFLLSILGTFMTRSGIFNSVHAFSQSDIGPTLLGFLALASIFSVGLLAARLNVLEPARRIEGGANRESSFLLNNLLLVTLTFTVLLGTVFPLIVEAVQGTRLSVGEPYFNRMAVPLGVALLFLMGIGPALPWGRGDQRRAWRALGPAAATGAALAGLGALLGARGSGLLAALFAGGFALQVTVWKLLEPALARAPRDGLPRALGSLFGAGRRRMGAYVVHGGVILVLIAVAASGSLRQSTEVSLAEGGSAPLGPYRMLLLGTSTEAEAHREALVAQVAVTRDGRTVARLEPRMNYYPAMREPVGTPAVHSRAGGDIYLSALSIDTARGVVGLRAFLNPLVVWIWLGAGVMVLGALLALWPAPRKSTARPRALGRADIDEEPRPAASGLPRVAGGEGGPR